MWVTQDVQGASECSDLVIIREVIVKLYYAWDC